MVLTIRIKILAIVCCIILYKVSGAQNYTRSELDSFATIPVPEIVSQSEKLIPIFKDVVAQQQKNNLYYNEAKCYAALRLMYAYIGQYDSATYYSYEAVRLYEKHGHKKEAAYLYAEAGYSAKNKNLPLAEKQMRRGLAMLAELKDTAGLAGQYNNYGVIKEFKKEYDSAQYYYQLSLDYKYKLGDVVGIPYSILNLGTLAGINKNYRKAEDSIQRAIVLFDETNNIPTKAESIFELAEIFHKQRNYKAATQTFEDCIGIATPISYLRLIMECHRRLSEINEESGALKESLFHRKQYNIIYDSLMNETGIKAIAAMQTKYDVVKKEERIAKQELKIKDRNNQMLLGLIIVSLLGFGIFYYIKRLRFKKKLERIEFENKMREDRERISRDLHDNIGSQLAFIISGAGIKQADKEGQLSQIASFAKDTLNQLRATVWAIKKEKIAISEFAEQIELFIEKVKPNSLIDFTIKKDVQGNTFLSPSQSIHIFRVIQESISNAVKHSECYGIIIDIVSKNNQLDITVADDGKGFDTNDKKLGNGLRFMQERMTELDGKLKIESSESGTTVACSIAFV